MKNNKQPAGMWIRPKKRLAIYLRDGMKCMYCNTNLKNEQKTLDHVKLVSEGGDNHESNLVTCCNQCNRRRKNKQFESFVGVKERQRIREVTRLSLKPYLTIAELMISGKLEKVPRCL